MNGAGITYEDVVAAEVTRKYQQELDRLNNIINELEKGLKSVFDFNEDVVNKDYLECIELERIEDVLNKLKDLKGSGKE